MSDNQTHQLFEPLFQAETDRLTGNSYSVASTGAISMRSVESAPTPSDKTLKPDRSNLGRVPVLPQNPTSRLDTVSTARGSNCV